jgi:hypothetical protein
MAHLNGNINFCKIDELVEGDKEFQNQLLDAIITAIKELEVTYMNALDQKCANTLRLARHKIKPTVGMFELNRLAVVLQEGKYLMAKNGIAEELEAHKHAFLQVTSDLLQELHTFNINNSKNSALGE